jgi:hypothetical protein
LEPDENALAEPIMRNFASIASFVEFLETRVEATRHAQKEGLNAAGAMLVHEARATIGEYQDAAGPFPAWPELSEATLYGGVNEVGYHYPGKVELGYSPPDNPLLRTGQMRASIEHEASEAQVIFGTNDPVAVFQEFGTEKMPARSFIGATMYRHAHEVTGLAVKFIMAAFCGSPKPHGPMEEHGED